MKLVKGVMGMKHKRLEDTPLSTNFRLPAFMFGSSLEGEEQETFEKLQRMFRALVRLNTEKGVMVQLLEISDTMEELFSKSTRGAMNVTSEFYDYLRSKFVGSNTAKMRAAINLLDFLMKNASTYRNNSHLIYHFTSKRRMLKTLARCARDLTRSGSVDSKARLVGVDILGCIQTWGEAFSSSQRRELYGFYSAYKQLEEKYNVSFPYAPFDPTRVPIILSDVSDYERQLALNASLDSNDTLDDSMDADLGLSGAVYDVGEGARYVPGTGEVAQSQIGDLISFDDVTGYARDIPKQKTEERKDAMLSSPPAWLTEDPPLPPPPVPVQDKQPQPQPQPHHYQYQYPVQVPTPERIQHGSQHLRHPQSEPVRPSPMAQASASAFAATPHADTPRHENQQHSPHVSQPHPTKPVLESQHQSYVIGDAHGGALVPTDGSFSFTPQSLTTSHLPLSQVSMIPAAPHASAPSTLITTREPIMRDNVNRIFPYPGSESSSERFDRAMSDLVSECATKLRQPSASLSSVGKQISVSAQTPQSRTLSPIPTHVFENAAEDLAQNSLKNAPVVKGDAPQQNPDPAASVYEPLSTLSGAIPSRGLSVSMKAAAFEEIVEARNRSRVHSNLGASDRDGRTRTSEDVDVCFLGHSRIVKSKDSNTLQTKTVPPDKNEEVKYDSAVT